MSQDRLETAAPSSADEIVALEQSLYRAMVDREFQTLRDLLSDDLSYVHSTGVSESKAQYLAGVANGLYEYERIDSREVTVRVDHETSVESGEVEMSVGAAGEPKTSIRLLFTLVWIKKAGRWRVLRRQATRIPPRGER